MLRAAPGGLAVSAGEEVGYGLGEVPQCLLLYHLAALAQPSMLGASFGELGRLRAVAWSIAAAGAPPGPLLDRQIPDIPGMSAVPGQDILLLGRWHEPVPGHESDLLATADNPGEVQRHFFLRLKARIPTPRI